MNRDIEFRAWDTLTNEMVEVQELFFGTQDSMYCGADGIRINEVYSSDRMKIMQYTGLKDKNGVEIYEGDRVTNGSVTGPSLGDYRDFMPIAYAVEFQRGCFVVKCTPDCTSERIFEDYHLLEEMGEVEVVSNIYENPELLEETK